MADNILKNDSGFTTLVVPAMTGGYTKDKPAYLMDDDQCENAKNLIIKKGILKLDTGYVKFGNVVGDHPRAVFQFYLTSGSSYLVLVTDDKMYYYDIVSENWYYVRSSTYTDTTLATAATTTDNHFHVASAASFTAARNNLIVGIILDDGTEHHVSTAIAVGDSVSITGGGNFPSGAAIGNRVRITRDFAGDPDEPVQFAVMPAYDWLIVTNGNNVPRYYDGDALGTLPLLPAGLTAAQSCCVFNGYLILGSTVESGANYKQRLRWNLDPTTNNWDPAVDPTSGYIDLYDTEDWIQQLQTMGPYLMVYRERSIYRGEYIGASDITFSWITCITGEGAISGNAVADMGDYHIFCGQSNVYEYRGGFDLTPIGDDVWYAMFGTEGNLDPEFKYRTQVLYVEELEELWVLYCSTTSTSEYPDRLLRYRGDIKTWTWRQLTNAVSGVGYYQRNSSLTWANMLMPWTTVANPWDAVIYLSNAYSVLLCGGDSLQVYEYDYSTEGDDGTSLPWTMITKAWYDPHYFMMVDSLEFKGTGGPIEIYYRTEENGAWNTWGSITLSTTMQRYRTFKQFQTRYLQLKLSGTGGGFSIEYLAVKFQQTTEW